MKGVLVAVVVAGGALVVMMLDDVIVDTLTVEVENLDVDELVEESEVLAKVVLVEAVEEVEEEVLDEPPQALTGIRSQSQHRIPSLMEIKLTRHPTSGITSGRGSRAIIASFPDVVIVRNLRALRVCAGGRPGFSSASGISKSRAGPARGQSVLCCSLEVTICRGLQTEWLLGIKTVRNGQTGQAYLRSIPHHYL